MPEAPERPPVPNPFRAPARPALWHRRRVEVRDDSMRPTLWPGDRLLVDLRAYRDRPPQTGDLVVVVDPAEGARWLVKRVVAVGPGRWWRTEDGLRPERDGPPTARPPEPIDLAPGTVWVQGDAPAASRDSRRFGPVPPAGIVGRVYRRYAPPERRRNL